MYYNLIFEVQTYLFILFWFVILIFMILTANELTTALCAILYVGSYIYFNYLLQDLQENAVHLSLNYVFDWFLVNVAQIIFIICMLFLIVELLYNFILS